MAEEQVDDRPDPQGLRETTQRVLRDLERLEELIDRGAIESDMRRIGAEQELFLVDRRWEPAPAIERMLEELDDAHFTCEIGRFNLEINLDPLELAGSCFRTMESHLRRLVGQVADVAAQQDLVLVLTGILPTLRLDHLTLENMTSRPRYIALNEAMTRLRGGEFAIHVRGLDELTLEHTNVMLEACNTSFQVHFQVSPAEFAPVYNAAQAVAGPVLAVAVNSPVLLGRRLWAETRIPLFQQSVDTRTPVAPQRRRIPRVSFGRGWVEESVLEIYREDVGRFPAMLVIGEGAEEEEGEEPPSLRGLCSHNGTVYRWNRPCYGVTAGRPHLRIENRYLPSGPTIVDEIANAALWCGLVAGVTAEYPRIDEQMPFDQARRNFVAAAQDGLGARFDWMGRTNEPAGELLRAFLLPLAREGLEELSIDEDEIDRYLGIVDERAATGRTGARWILESLGSEAMGSAELATLTAAMHGQQHSGRPVAQWSLAPARSDRLSSRELRVRDVMTPSPFAVRQEQAIDLAGSLMDWRRIRHVPVEDSKHRFLGLVTYRSLLRALLDPERDASTPLAVRDAMLDEVVTVAPETRLAEALRVMEERDIGCLPVVEREQLVGVISERDFLPVARRALADPAGESGASDDD